MLVDCRGGAVVSVALLVDLVSGCDSLWDASPKLRGFDPNILCEAEFDEMFSDGFLKLDEDWKAVDENVLVGWAEKPLDDVEDAAAADDDDDDDAGVVLAAAADCDPVNPWNDPSKLDDVNVRLNDEDNDDALSFD